MLARREGASIVVPGFASAHSHGFQRGLRGRTQARSGNDDFWSWRDLMYRLASGLDPEAIYALSHFAFVELALSGVTAVGEFHYVHHQAGGAPYSDRIILADAVIRAARDAGLRVALLRVLYNRSGPGSAATEPQRRFCDPNLDSALADVEDLRSRHRGDPMVSIGIAPHSIRAVPLAWIESSARHAAKHDLPFHMHVAEQPREIAECTAEYGGPPVEMLAEAGALRPEFVAVHATHLGDREVDLLGEHGCGVCVCRTTERDLGDGLPRVADLLSAGAWLCTGVDSDSVSDPFEEIRAIELDERSRQLARNLVGGTTLLEAGTAGGYRAIGLEPHGDEVVLDSSDPALIGIPDSAIDDAVVFAGSPRAVREVRVAGERIVVAGQHSGYPAARQAYEATLTRLLG